MNNKKSFEKMTKLMDLRGFALTTKKSYLNAIRQLSAFYPIPFEEMGTEHIREFLFHSIKERKLSNQYISILYSGIKFLFEAVLEKNWNVKHIPRVRKKLELPTTLSQSEVLKLLNSVTNLKHKTILTVIYSAGLRVGEAAKLKVSDIDSKNMRIFIYQGKGNKDRYAHLANTTLLLLRQYYKSFRPKEWLFEGVSPKDKSTIPISTRTIQSFFRKTLLSSGITIPASTHTLRHSYATHLVESGVNLLRVKELLGHSSIDSTMKYIHLANKDILDIKSPIDNTDFTKILSTSGILEDSLL